jgi:hypothetical protein
MLRTSLIIFLLLFISAPQLCSQQKVKDNRILFRGVVISSSGKERLSGSQIFINRSFRTSSLEDGTFSFYALRSDTIVFTMLGFKPASMVVSDTLKASEFLTGVYLESDTVEIGEVIIIPRFTNLKAEMMNPKIESNVQLENAISNISNAAYVGRTTAPKMGDSYINYEVLRNKQMRAAIEKGGIPSDQMVALNPLMLIPAMYLLLHGMPEEPAPPVQSISQHDLDELNRLFSERLKKR